MNKEISCAMAKLNDPNEAAILIDHTLQQCWLKSRPVYITLPTDIVQKKVEGKRLETPIDLHFPQNNPDKEDYVVEVVLKYLLAAKNPIILVDACAVRHRVLEEVHDLIEKTGLPVFVTPMGKGAVNEEHPNYGGVYAGDGSQAAVQERVEASDLILTIGAIKVRPGYHSVNPLTDHISERLQHCRLHIQDISAQYHRLPQHARNRQILGISRCTYARRATKTDQPS